MFRLLTARVTISVLLVPLQRVSVVLLPALWCEVREEGMVSVGVSLVVVARWSGGRARLMRMVMMKFVFALLVSLLAAGSLLHF